MLLAMDPTYAFTINGCLKLRFIYLDDMVSSRNFTLKGKLIDHNTLYSWRGGVGPVWGGS